VASSAYDECCFRLRSLDLVVSPFCPLNAHHCTRFMFPDPLIHILSSCYPSKVVYNDFTCAAMDQSSSEPSSPVPVQFKNCLDWDQTDPRY
jgi:hypothetical protein